MSRNLKRGLAIAATAVAVLLGSVACGPEKSCAAPMPVPPPAPRIYVPAPRPVMPAPRPVAPAPRNYAPSGTSRGFAPQPAPVSHPWPIYVPFFAGSGGGC